MVYAVCAAGCLAVVVGGCSRWPGKEQPAEPTEQAQPAQLLSEEQVVAIAETVPEVKAFYSLDRRVKPCIERVVKRSCDSDYVTCRDNAWVVQYQISQECPTPISTDGRLSVNLLIDGVTGKVISRFPEMDYFRDRQFCRNDDDCLCSLPKDHAVVRCLNFMYEPVSDNTLQDQDTGQDCGGCLCQKHVCRAVNRISE